MNHYKAMAQLKDAILSAQTLDELYVLMEDYSYLEFIQIYNQLMPKQQAAINAICDRDNKIQMAAIKTLALQVGQVPKSGRRVSTSC